MRFYSKKGKILFPGLLCVLILMAVSTLSPFLEWDLLQRIPGADDADRGSWIIAIPLMLLIIWLIASTYYEIQGEVLKVTAGPIRYTMSIHTIRAVEASNNPISSPALSLDRLRITYNQNDRVLISPKDQKAFVDELMKINPAIKVRLKNENKR
ncbi:PH domain-containing protein [Rossellomorea aquimaris]|uniref:PH domain-containing protein n=1 Tax=Rossellomorea aquimaris TaxID=189382 RepID=UPI001CD39331|nr:PH domain-containing protein [Rossellomorea aquimaris]MCA1053853.1 PH domain-containing protein [Rossellomorea aquimaris]